MLDLRRGTLSRGASVLAALVVLGILGGVFAVFDAVSPQEGLTTTVYQSETATAGATAYKGSQTAAAADSATPVEVRTSAPMPMPGMPMPSRTSVSSLPVKPGMDFLLLLYNTSSGPTSVRRYFTVCPTEEVANSLPANIPRTQIDSMRTGAAEIRSRHQGDFGNAQGSRCETVNNVQRPKAGVNWMPWTFWCEAISPQTVTTPPARAPRPADQPQMVSYQEIAMEDDVQEVRQTITDQRYRCGAGQGNGPQSMLPPTPVNTQASDLAQRLAQAQNQTERDAILAQMRASGIDQSVLRGALTEQQQQIQTGIETRTQELQRTQTELQRLADAGVNSGACAASAPAPATVEASAVLAVTAQDCERLGTATRDSARLQAEIAAQRAQLANLAAAQTSLQPTGGPPMPMPTGCQGANCGAAPYGAGNPGGNTFGNAPVANGQQCQQSYVCQGNTLYYRSASPLLVSREPIIVQTQCSMQPVQQCPYGCAQPFGAAGAAGGATNAQSIMAFIPLISSVMNMFGGQNNNGMNGMATMGQSTQCSPFPQQQAGAAQQQAPYGTGSNGQACSQPQPQQPPPASCTAGSWQPQSSQGNGCVSGWQCVPSPTAPADAPKASLSCQPKTADIGMKISVSYVCDNTTDASAVGFTTTGNVGTAVATVAAPADGTNSVNYSLTCKNAQGLTSTAQCKIDIVKPLIVLVANPKVVKSGESSSIGWITSGMQSCKISNADFRDWTAQQANNTNVNGALQTPPITKNTMFVLDCNSAGGQTKESTVQINVQQ